MKPCLYCGGTHWGSPVGKCVFQCHRCLLDTRDDAVGFGHEKCKCDPRAARKHVAGEYTEAALEEVRQLREDVTRTEDAFAEEHDRLRLEMEPWWSEDDPHKPTEEDFAAQGGCVIYWVRHICSTERILARLQALLAAKSAGIKPEAL